MDDTALKHQQTQSWNVEMFDNTNIYKRKGMSECTTPKPPGGGNWICWVGKPRIWLAGQLLGQEELTHSESCRYGCQDPDIMWWFHIYRWRNHGLWEHTKVTKVTKRSLLLPLSSQCNNDLRELMNYAIVHKHSSIYSYHDSAIMWWFHITLGLGTTGPRAWDLTPSRLFSKLSRC